MILGLQNTQVAVKLQLRWHHPFCQMYLQQLHQSLQLCGHNGHHDKNIESNIHNPNFNLDESGVVKCSGCI